MSFLAQYWHELQPENPAKSSAILCEPRRFTDPGFYAGSPSNSPKNSPSASPIPQQRISALFADLFSGGSQSSDSIGWKGSTMFNSTVLEGCGSRGAVGADQRE
eukprot:gnl/MRDRNA2_/MRDRNA2_209098_c0_seq1.p2 gnl/MRDRNA2_/MRDRNA2_209098_c0~~gnl/MRDRNA2_/MRDRNA2_209098_c0_seq1.p2  ORF type:complete len:104 (+),score=13.17 gnl/MRDRNA2_/MRDRNA2_209098_c0_seq1:148-459(+)